MRRATISIPIKTLQIRARPNGSIAVYGHVTVAGLYAAVCYLAGAANFPFVNRSWRIQV
ncbi:hypothetical protein BDV36DRAFT_263248 [Aspergillus pseudocaelatus]|uniref:Uncharacterized protein n=1 Tax=Aspergillus pseudocaelatus TaxID=1825620 RepID=A0ABQ6WDP9_9EURO|nr:hypothetical protein BDV36DRAFT_263248 [Aspergillus pseudocaelatus]